MSVTVPFATRVVKDYTGGNIMKNEAELARDLRIVIEKLGPTFIKVQHTAHTTVLIVRTRTRTRTRTEHAFVALLLFFNHSFNFLNNFSTPKTSQIPRYC